MYMPVDNGTQVIINSSRLNNMGLGVYRYYSALFLAHSCIITLYYPIVL